MNLHEFQPYAHQLPKHEAKQMVEHSEDKSGKKRIKGGRDLKSSQSYPRQWSWMYLIVRLCISKGTPFYLFSPFLWCPGDPLPPAVSIRAPCQGLDGHLLDCGGYYKQMQRGAKQVIKRRLKEGGGGKYDWSSDAKWIKSADLRPVLDYLM